MLHKIHAYLIILLVVFSITACAKSHTPTTTPVNEPQDSATIQTANHYLLGYYLIQIDQAAESYEIIPMRGTSDHWNVISFIERSPCTDCFKITDFYHGVDGTFNFVTVLDHPIPDPVFTMFDVRGIMMFNGSRFFPEHGLVVSDSSLDDFEFVNADGYTTLYNAYTWGSGLLGYQGYIAGNFSTIAMPNATLNGFRRFESYIPDNSRNVFLVNTFSERAFKFKFPDDPVITLGYAFDASWEPPTVFPVTDPINDFPISANCPEPWKIEIHNTVPRTGLTIHGGQVTIPLDIYDWQGSTSHFEPAIECPDIFDGIRTGVLVSDSGDYSSWEITVENEKLAPIGSYPALVSVEDKSNVDSEDHLNLAAYQMMKLNVVSGGWARSWGGEEVDFANGVATDSDGNIYVTGEYKASVDFNPGEGTTYHESNGNADAFLSKFDPSGNLIWNRVWGGEWWEGGEDIAIDCHDHVYVAGFFNETVDFDPDPDVVEEYSSHGDWDSFIVKYTPGGNFEWARCYGSSMWDKALDVAVDFSCNVYACGFFRGTCDFDPIEGGYILESNPGASYLTKFTGDGVHEWAIKWAGNGGYDDLAYGVAAEEIGNIFVTGVFDGTVDLNPGPGTKNYTAPTVYNDIYLSCFDPAGDFQWGYAWGEDSDDWGYGVEVDNIGNVYATGKFAGTIDFDPTPAFDNHASNGERDVYLVKYTNSGDYQWAQTWGGTSSQWNNSDSGMDLAVDGNFAIVTGYYNATVDFDPDPDFADEYTSSGNWDIFLNAFDPNGYHVWTRVHGGVEQDIGRGICIDPADCIITTGWFNDTVDFNPYSETFALTSYGAQDCFLVKYLPYGNW